MTLVPLPLLALLLAGAPDVPAPAPSPWWAVEPAGSGPGWQVEASARAVLGTGRTAYALYDNLGFLKVSNLDFHGLAGAGLEVRIRAANRARLWATATLGLDARSAGTLQDEDFPVPGLLADYSSTDSALHGGGAWHLAAAAGYDVHQGAATRLAFFAGGLYVMGRVVKANPMLVLAGALAVYLGQVLFLGVVILSLSGASWLDGTSFGLSVLAVALIWQLSQVVAFVKMRKPVYDNPVETPDKPVETAGVPADDPADLSASESATERMI